MQRYMIYDEYSDGRIFRLSFVCKTDVDIETLANILNQDDTQKVTKLDLSASTISKNGARQLVQILNRKSHIKQLALSLKKFQTDGDEVANEISKTTTLELLNMSNCGITAKGINGFVNNRSLTTLILCDNSIGDDAVIGLASNPTLETLLLGMMEYPDQFKYSDAVAIAFGKSKTLKHLHLPYNKLTDVGFKALASNKNSIEYFDLFMNKDTDAGSLAFTEKRNLMDISKTKASPKIENVLNQSIRINQIMPTLLICFQFQIAQVEKGILLGVLEKIVGYIFRLDPRVENVIHQDNIQGLTYENNGSRLPPLTPESKERLVSARQNLAIEAATIPRKIFFNVHSFFQESTSDKKKPRPPIPVPEFTSSSTESEKPCTIS